MTTFADQLFQFGGAAVGLPVVLGAKYLFVDGQNGSDGNPGTAQKPFATVQAAVDLIEDSEFKRAVIGVAPDPDGYAETVTIARPSSANAGAILMVGCGPKGSVFIDPSTEDAAGMLVHRDDVTLVNIGVAAEDDTSAAALTVTGSRFRAYSCKFEGGADQLICGPGTVAQEAAGTRGTGADGYLYDCEICWGTDGIVVQASDYGAVTQWRLEKCWFHNLTANGIAESTGSGGSADIVYRNLVIKNCTFDDLEDGTAPTNAYIDLNGNNANTGQLVQCWFPQAANGGKVLLSTALHCVGVFFTGGLSTGQPS